MAMDPIDRLEAKPQTQDMSVARFSSFVYKYRSSGFADVAVDDCSFGGPRFGDR